MRLARCVLLVALTVVGACRKKPVPRPIVAKPAAAQVDGCAIRAEAVPLQPTIPLGEKSYVRFRVTTDCAKPLVRRVYALPGRPEGYTITAADAYGAPAREIPEPAVTEGGGATGYNDLGRDRPLEDTLEVTAWIAFDAPGRYEVTVTRRLDVGKSKDDLATVTLAPTAVIEVQK